MSHDLSYSSRHFRGPYEGHVHSVLPNTKRLDGSILYSHLKSGAFTLGWLLRGPCCWAEANTGTDVSQNLVARLRGATKRVRREEGKEMAAALRRSANARRRGKHDGSSPGLWQLLVYKMGGLVPRESRQTCTSHRNLLTYKTSCGFFNPYFQSHSSVATLSWELLDYRDDFESTTLSSSYYSK